MRLCKKNHEAIVYSASSPAGCPLCSANDELRKMALKIQTDALDWNRGHEAGCAGQSLNQCPPDCVPNEWLQGWTYAMFAKGGYKGDGK